VPITILRARPAAACLFFGKIAGGRGLARSHFLFPSRRSGLSSQEIARPGFASGLPLVHLNEITLGHCWSAP
jgi:hypothetical protein